MNTLENPYVKYGLLTLGNLVITSLVVFLYHFYVNKPLVKQIAFSSQTVYTVNSKKLLEDYEQQIKTAVLAGDLDKAEQIKQQYIDYLGRLEKAAKKVAQDKEITIFVSDAVVESKNVVDISKTLERMAKVNHGNGQ